METCVCEIHCVHVLLLKLFKLFDNGILSTEMFSTVVDLVAATRALPHWSACATHAFVQATASFTETICKPGLLQSSSHLPNRRIVNVASYAATWGLSEFKKAM